MESLQLWIDTQNKITSYQLWRDYRVIVTAGRHSLILSGEKSILTFRSRITFSSFSSAILCNSFTLIPLLLILPSFDFCTFTCGWLSSFSC